MALPKLTNPPAFDSSFTQLAGGNEEQAKHLHAVAFLGEKPNTLAIATTAMELRAVHDAANLGAAVNERIGAVVKSWEQKYTALEKELSAAKSENATLQAQLADPALGGQLLVEMTREKEAACRDRDQTKAELLRTTELLTLAEGAAGLLGVDPAQAVRVSDRPLPRKSEAEYEARIQAAQTPHEQAAIAKEFEAACQQGNIAQ